MKTKLLVIGLDAVNGSLIRQWASEGVLPNFAALMDGGRTATIHGVDGFFTGSTWPSVLTGTSPARHGIHYLLQLVPGSYRFARPHEAEYIRAPMFWEALSKAGKRSAILDVPLAKLDPDVCGIQTVEWGGHDCIFGFQTSPTDLRADILSHHGRHPVPSDCDKTERTLDGFREFVETLIRGIEAKAALTRDLLLRESWDLLFQVFTETHCVGHQCWHLHDTAHPAHDHEIATVIGDPVQRVYQAIDKAIGDLVEAAGNVPVLVVCPHGMSHSIGTPLLLPQVLSRLGVSVPLPEPPPRPPGPEDIARAVGRRLPGPVKSVIKRLLERPISPGSFGVPTLDVDTTSSRCFVVPNGLMVSGIRLNLAGREPDGIVQPGAEADALCDELARDLLEIQDDRTQAPLVRRVLRTAHLYEGPNLDCLPDLLIEWNDSTAVGTTALNAGTDSRLRASSAKIGTVEVVNRYGRTGEHRVEGLLIASGPGIRDGGEEHTISIFDVAPTIAAALGVRLTTAEGREMSSMIPTAA